jgi:thioesterase domain-containing protein/acyl carrier protein
MIILGSILEGSNCTVGAAHVRWGKFLRTAYLEVPHFLEDLHAEAQRAAPVATGSGGFDADAMAALSPEERRATILSTVHRLARDVVDDSDLTGDAPLLDSGMDSLSGVEFRNRLLMEFQGIRIPNSAVFDYPTVEALAEFVNNHYSAASGSATAAETSPAIADAGPSDVQLVERLNDRSIGSPVFLVPGAGLQSGPFRSLASLLPVPVYAVSWPRGFRERANWPATLRDLAEILFHEIESVWPSGPYFFAGHSFGAALCAEMAHIAESSGHDVAMVALLDPRHLPPIHKDVHSAISEHGIVDSLALLSQTADDGARYAGAVEKLLQVAKDEREAAIRSMLSPAAMASLEHVHETSQWLAGLIMNCTSQSEKILARVCLIRAAETWKEDFSADDANVAETVVRSYQERTFQDSDVVTERVSRISQTAYEIKVPAGHFDMLREPSVVTLALQLCRGLVESQKKDDSFAVID